MTSPLDGPSPLDRTGELDRAGRFGKPGRRDRAGWGVVDVPDQRGRTAVITGGNCGLGFETARVLAERGATVVLACRDLTKAEQATARLRADVPGAAVQVESLDLLSPTSIHAAAERIRAAYPRLDLLINNAGVMLPTPLGALPAGGVLPADDARADVELTFATNHLGPFAFTGLLLDRLLATPDSRIVTVSSLVHHAGRVDVDSLARLPERQSRRLHYPRSKLANLMFAFELQRRLAAAGAPTISLAAHPGIARTELTRNLAAPAAMFLSARAAPVMSWLVQSPRMGALAILRAATDPTASGAAYYGPAGWFGSTGRPAPARSSARSRDTERQRRLWTESERLTGITYRFD